MAYQPYQPRDPGKDASQRMLRMAARLKPGGQSRPKRIQEKPYELDDATRKSLLSKISDKTIGSLYQFGNVLDLPVSSVRDVASTLTGTPRNPFDQWFSPTTDKNRITQRDLLRQWGLISKKDTWGNLAGSIAADIAMDPLTYLGLGSSSLTKLGRMLKEAGLTRNMTRARSLKNAEFSTKAIAELPGAVAPELTKLGPREAWQTLTAEDMINAAGDTFQQAGARKTLEETAKRFGFDSYEAAAKELGPGLKGYARFGLPQWKMFGADKLDKLKSSPGVILGKPGSERMLSYAKRMDKIMGVVSDNPVSQHLKGLMYKAAQGMTIPATQIAAKAGWLSKQTGQHAARATVSDITRMYENLVGGDMSIKSLQGVSKEQAVLMHREMRSLLEGYGVADPGTKVVLDNMISTMETTLARARDRGINLEALDDDFNPRYFVRQLTAMLGTDDITELKNLKYNPFEGMVTSTTNEFMQSRVGLLRDWGDVAGTVGGSKLIDKVVTDQNIGRFIADETLSARATDSAVASYIEQTYGDVLTKEYRGDRMTNPNKSQLSPEIAAEYESVSSKIRNRDTFAAILDDPNLTEVEKARLTRMRLSDEFSARMDSNWEGPEIGPRDTIYKELKTRYADLAKFIRKLSPEGRKLGLFGNHPIADLENYLMKWEDSFSKADTVMDILSNHSVYPQPGELVGATSIRKLLSELGFDSDKALPMLSKRLGLDDTEDAIASLGNAKVAAPVERNLKQYQRMFSGPEAAGFFGRIADSFISTFKMNVTSPFPGFHLRNEMSGQFRNMVAGQFSFKALHQMNQMMHGKMIEGVEKWPIVIQRHNTLQQKAGGMLAAELSNKEANKILSYMMRDAGITGKYGGRSVVRPGDYGIATEDIHQYGGSHGAGSEATSSNAGLIEDTISGAPGQNPFSWSHARRQYLGQGHPTRVQTGVDDAGKPIFKDEKIYKTELLGGRYISPFPTWDLPLYGARKLTSRLMKGKEGKKFMGRETMNRWRDEKFFRLPTEWKTPGVYEAAGLTGSSKRLDERTTKWFGPGAGGFELGHYAEGMNRGVPFMKMIQSGIDPAVAARRVAEMHIEYGAKNFTSFENQALKRMFPFYSFTSRSLPWSLRKFYEQPGNLLSQVVRGTKRIGEDLQEKQQDIGPVPPYIRDTLAIPLKSPGEGVKRFLTGADVMSQDLWQLMMPLLSGDLSEFGYEVAGRGNPALVKLPVESITGTSLWQRGVEGGRPLRTMYPPFGGMWSNLSQTWSKMTGEEFDKESYKKLIGMSGAERLIGSSPWTRYLSTIRTAADVRKGPLAKAINLLSGAKVTDVSLRAQESITREYIRDLIRKLGGSVFEKATFSRSDLAKMTPAELQQALPVKALMDERTKIAKEMAGSSRLKRGANIGVPGMGLLTMPFA